MIYSIFFIQKTYIYYTVVDSCLFESVILANEPFAKALRSLKTCLPISNNSFEN